MLKRVSILFAACALAAAGQSNRGELRLRVADTSGAGVRASVQVVSEANQIDRTLATDEQGNLIVQRLPYGVYRVEVKCAGFSDAQEWIEIGSSIPIERKVELRVSAVSESVTVAGGDTLINPDQAGSIQQIGADSIATRPGSVPGRSMQELVNSQPGWLYEGNAVLHPRGSEYQTQFVVDGIPLIDNRSPSFGPQIEADDAESVSIYTAGIPAEYG